MSAIEQWMRDLEPFRWGNVSLEKAEEQLLTADLNAAGVNYDAAFLAARSLVRRGYHPPLRARDRVADSRGQKATVTASVAEDGRIPVLWDAKDSRGPSHGHPLLEEIHRIVPKHDPINFRPGFDPLDETTRG